MGFVEETERSESHLPIPMFLSCIYNIFLFIFIFYFCNARAHVRVFVSLYRAHFHVAYVPDKYVSALLEFMKMHIFILSSRIIGVNSMS